jgi:hypothetical protein
MTAPFQRPALLTTDSWPFHNNFLVFSSFPDYQSESESESYVTADGQSASLSWNKAPIWDLRPDFYYCQTVENLLMWNALSGERTGLWFTIAAGPHQRSHFRVQVPWDSRLYSYFTVSGSRLPLSSPPTTHRATMEVFAPASTRDDYPSNLVPCL